MASRKKSGKREIAQGVYGVGVSFHLNFLFHRSLRAYGTVHTHIVSPNRTEAPKWGSKTGSKTNSPLGLGVLYLEDTTFIDCGVSVPCGVCIEFATITVLLLKLVKHG
jgi:hypothetical protein